ncbi:uncharacterized protein [Chiloscyllium punctatum]|uniref:uncharacterized protein n=1 Tax=Chiloscyllium punctatum TaxID=137246 RepID=UPI003B642B06
MTNSTVENPRGPPPSKFAISLPTWSTMPSSTSPHPATPPLNPTSPNRTRTEPTPNRPQLPPHQPPDTSHQPLLPTNGPHHQVYFSLPTPTSIPERPFPLRLPRQVHAPTTSPHPSPGPFPATTGSVKHVSIPFLTPPSKAPKDPSTSDRNLPQPPPVSSIASNVVFFTSGRQDTNLWIVSENHSGTPINPTALWLNTSTPPPIPSRSWRSWAVSIAKPLPPDAWRKNTSYSTLGPCNHMGSMWNSKVSSCILLLLLLLFPPPPTLSQPQVSTRPLDLSITFPIYPPHPPLRPIIFICLSHSQLPSPQHHPPPPSIYLSALPAHKPHC